MVKLCCLAFMVTVGLPAAAHADSPLTSVTFHSVYPSRTISRASSGTLDEELSAYLADPKKPIDVKAALINALGWSTSGQHNAEVFLEYLADKYGRSVEELRQDYAATLNAHEVFCYGYLLAMDDYLEPEPAIAVLKVATRRNPRSYTVHIVAALARAQAAMTDDWCQAWKEVEGVRKNRKLAKDMKPAAVGAVFKYMRLYEDSCKSQEVRR